MKFLVTLVVLITTFFSYSQTLNLNNTIGFSYSDNSIKTYNGTVTSINTYERQFMSYSNTLNEAITYSNKITQHEFANKFIVNYSKEHMMLFLTDQTNYSLSRNLNMENLFGGGIGRRDSVFGIKINYSLGLLYDKINNTGMEYLRYSGRIKLSQVKQKFSWSTEYYYQPDILDRTNLTVYGTTKFSLKLNNYISMTITDIYNYYSISKVKTIHSFTFGVTYLSTK